MTTGLWDRETFVEKLRAIRKNALGSAAHQFMLQDIPQSQPLLVREEKEPGPIGASHLAAAAPGCSAAWFAASSLG